MYEYAKFNLKRRGIKIVFFRKITENIENCDLLIVSSWTLAPLNSVDGEAIARLEAWSSQTKVVWSDESDSSGTTQFEVMPYVSAYWKKQVLRDRSLYGTQYVSGRIHFEFWQRHFGFEDAEGYGVADNWELAQEAYRTRKKPGEAPTRTTVLSPEFAHKLQCSWHLGLHDWRRGSHLQKVGFRIQDLVRISLRRGFKPPFLCDPMDARSYDVAGLFSAESERIVCKARRRLLQIVRDLPCSKIASQRRLPIDRYIRTLCQSKINIGTFGLGEICYREFETFCSGALLLTTDLSHLECYPDIFHENETYVPFSWDFSNLESVIEHYLRCPKDRIAVAESGQKRYLECWSEEGVESFSDRLSGLIVHGVSQ